MRDGGNETHSAESGLALFGGGERVWMSRGGSFREGGHGGEFESFAFLGLVRR